jgi:hypothetical protein
MEGKSSKTMREEGRGKAGHGGRRGGRGRERKREEEWEVRQE